MPRESVTVVEVGLRDGLQMLPQTVPTEHKLEWLNAEHASGLRKFEVASFVPAKLLPQMADAANVVAAAKRLPKIEVAALVPNVKGALAAIEAGADVLVVPVSASVSHSRSNVRRTPDEMVDTVRDICELRDKAQRRIHIHAGVATAFGCTIQGDVPEAEVERIVIGCAEAGADAVGLADTVGYANPEQVRRIFKRVRSAVGDRVNSAHFHDTRGIGLANVIAALEVGIRSFDASLGGLGGCPYAPGASGNIATEDLVFMLEAMGLNTGVRADVLIEAQQKQSELLPGQTFHGKLVAAGLPKNYVGHKAIAQ
jgi:hydroxymethylglutaryl-CoA lyase